MAKAVLPDTVQPEQESQGDLWAGEGLQADERRLQQKAMQQAVKVARHPHPLFQ